MAIDRARTALTKGWSATDNAADLVKKVAQEAEDIKNMATAVVQETTGGTNNSHARDIIALSDALQQDLAEVRRRLSVIGTKFSLIDAGLRRI